MTPTTKLEAINRMLISVGETPVASITGEDDAAVVTAVTVFDEVSRAVQLEGWAFNTEHGYPLYPDSSTKQIKVPTSALSVDIDKRRYWGMDPVLRGSFIYDRENHTYLFEQALEAKIVFGLEFDYLPEEARNYIAYRACRRYQDTSFGSDTLHRFNEQEEQRARALLLEVHSEDDDLNFLRDDPQFNGVLAR